MQERDIDPESNFFDQVTRNCLYYTEHQFKEKFNLENGISIVHFNSRSLNLTWKMVFQSYILIAGVYMQTLRRSETTCSIIPCNLT